MKNLFKLAVIILLFSITTASAQKVYNLDKQKDTTKVSYTITQDKAIYKGQEYPVYISKNGKLFIFVTSKKTGNKYKKYLN